MARAREFSPYANRQLPNLMTHQRGPVFNVRDPQWAATGDGSTNDAPAIQAAASALGLLDSGGTLFLPRGVYRLGATVTMPAKDIIVQGDGRGVTILEVANGNSSNYLPLSFASATGEIAVRDLTIREAGAANAGGGYGMYFTGTPQRISIDNVETIGLNIGLYCLGTSSDYIADVRVQNCDFSYAQTYGVMLAHTHNASFINCSAHHNKLDGLKFQKTSGLTHVVGGRYAYNGWDESLDPPGYTASNGNGMDAYAGGEGFKLFGGVYEYNNGAGLNIKTGALTGTDDYGYTRRGELHGVTCRYNLASGVEINRDGGDAAGTGATYPLVTHMKIIGGLFEYNDEAGIYLRGRNITLIGPHCRYNDQQGIIANSVWDLTMIAPIVTANSQASAGSYDGINIGGTASAVTAKRIKLICPTVNGKDADGQVDDDYSALTAYHRYSIRVNQYTDEVFIEEPTCLNWVSATTQPVSTAMTTGRMEVHFGTVPNSPATTPLFGSYGSTAYYSGTKYIKKAAVNDVATAWVAM